MSLGNRRREKCEELAKDASGAGVRWGCSGQSCKKQDETRGTRAAEGPRGPRKRAAEPWAEGPEGSRPLTPGTAHASGFERSLCLYLCLPQGSPARRDLQPVKVPTSVPAEWEGQGREPSSPGFRVWLRDGLSG